MTKQNHGGENNLYQGYLGNGGDRECLVEWNSHHEFTEKVATVSLVPCTVHQGQVTE